MLRSSAAEDACIPFCIVTEGATAGEYHELGFTEVDLNEIMQSGRDLHAQQLEVVDRDGQPIAALEVSVVALAVLKDVIRSP
jgi:hypothetical protein